jgi:hypothetical protein
VSSKRRAYTLRVDPLIFGLFEKRCARQGYRRVNRVLESMMLAAALRPGVFLLLMRLDPRKSHSLVEDVRAHLTEEP